jgi:hypothetical protein
MAAHAHDGCPPKHHHRTQRLSDMGLFCLARMASLEELHLSGCPRITDGGLLRLMSAAPHLRVVKAGDCRCTSAEGAAAAAAAASKMQGRLVEVQWSR